MTEIRGVSLSRDGGLTVTFAVDGEDPATFAIGGPALYGLLNRGHGDGFAPVDRVTHEQIVSQLQHLVQDGEKEIAGLRQTLLERDKALGREAEAIARLRSELAKWPESVLSSEHLQAALRVAANAEAILRSELHTINQELAAAREERESAKDALLGYREWFARYRAEVTAQIEALGKALRLPPIFRQLEQHEWRVQQAINDALSKISAA